MTANLFDANFYRFANADLATFDNNQLASHFFTYGLDEGRLFSPLVNLNLYRASNSDLSSFSNRQLYEHLSNFGVAEGRKFAEFFDLNYYRSRNGDLAQFNNEQLFGHAQNFGQAEGRRMSAFADINFYKGVNSDLANFNNVQALQHLVVYGVSEGRRFSAFVDLNLYNAANPDLRAIGFNNNQLLEHLVVYGANEGRRFSAGFDVNYYRGFYSDLVQAGLNNIQLLEHFQDFGVNEGRASSESFNATFYLANNADLRAAGFNNQQALQHFEIFGLREGRIGAPASSIVLGASRDDNTLGSAANLGVLNGSRNFSNQFVGSNDRNDYYRFTLAQTSNINVSVTGLTNDADLELIYDTNGNGAYDSGERVYRSGFGSTSNESIIQTLGAGTYFVRVYTDSSTANTNYSLGLNATPALPTTFRDAGNRFATALDLGTVSSNPNTPTTVREFVGTVDSNDYYRLTLGSTSNVNISVTGITNDVALEVIYDINGNGEYDWDERAYRSDNFGSTTNESISQTLGAGTYLIRVYTDSFSSNSNYTLGVSATPNLPTTPRDPGNTLGTALDIGTLTGSRSFRDFVGVADFDDYYRFNLATNRNFSLSLTGLTDDADVELIQDIDNDGRIDFGEVLRSSRSSGINNESIITTLGTGTYYVRVYSGSSGDNTAYNLSLLA